MLTVLLSFIFAQSSAFALPAFPGAEGFGTDTPGGRGGKVFEVTNLNDSGSGSLRACVQASGSRICVFRVGGLIDLQSSLAINSPYITIAGQTAPGGGITLKSSAGGIAVNVATHDVVIRYISLRPGPGGQNQALAIWKNGGTDVYNIVVDHCSMSWATDEVATSWYGPFDYTIQWSIISEGLDCSTHPKGCHSKGMMIGGYAGSESKNTIGARNATTHHNLIAHSAERGPLIQMCGTAQIVNNVVYNPRWTFSHQQDNCIIPNTPSTINWIGNYHKKGPDSTSNTDLKVIPSDEGVYSGGARVYVKGNIGPSRPSDSQPDSYWVDSGSRSFIIDTPAPAPAITMTDALTAYNNVLADAGNSQGLNCDGTWYNRRDGIDTRVANDVKNGTGHIIDDPSEVGGWITPAAGTACADSDHDGMPNAWEIANGLNPNDPSDANQDFDGDGYTNLEEYLNGTDPRLASKNNNNPLEPPTGLRIVGSYP
jgi:pectate lyase